MLSVNVSGYQRACSPGVGGCDMLLVGDASDFNFTEGAVDANGNATGYSTIILRTGGGTGATATAAVTGGAVTGFTVTAGGTGYTMGALVTLGGPGTGAVGTAVVVGGILTAINLVSGGTGYTTAPTVTLAPNGATAAGGAYLYNVDSLIDSINVEVSQADSEGASSAYEFAIVARLAKASQALTNFSKKLDLASICGNLLVVWRQNDGSIFVAGEKFVGSSTIPRFRIRQDGSKSQTGKKFSDFNGTDLSLKGTYLRGPYEYTGGIAGLSAFIAP